MASYDQTSSANALSPSPGHSPYHSPSPGPSSPLRPATPIRRLPESSGSGSDYDLSSVPDAKNLPPAHKEYALVHASNHLDLEIFSPNITDPSTFKDKKTSPFTSSTTLSSRPIIASAKFSTFSKKSAIGLGSPNKPNEVVWEELRRTRKTFIWTRTHNDKFTSSDPDTAKRSHHHLKLVQETTGEVVALYLGNGLKSWHKMGKFQNWKSWGYEWELIVLLTGLSLIEKARRRARARSAARANGGGGRGRILEACRRASKR
ncbi:MAG: hypothetical protein M1812_000348 [Candelaria pacifica]|nr:MAG: hypothetical protein M1812_000348 [Candelaria pacifica]